MLRSSHCSARAAGGGTGVPAVDPRRGGAPGGGEGAGVDVGPHPAHTDIYHDVINLPGFRFGCHYGHGIGPSKEDMFAWSAYVLVGGGTWQVAKQFSVSIEDGVELPALK